MDTEQEDGAPMVPREAPHRLFFSTVEDFEGEFQLAQRKISNAYFTNFKT